MKTEFKPLYYRILSFDEQKNSQVTDIRYREDGADLNKPEDLPVSVLSAFGNKSH